jgi:GTP pyrophosphokinase
LWLQVCVLVHEIQRVREVPLRIQVYDEPSSAAVREQCLTLCDVRAVLIEVVCRIDQLQNCSHLSTAKQQVLALQVRPAHIDIHTLNDLTVSW